MDDMTTPPEMITPLETRAIRRFEYDRKFHLRVHVEARHRRELDPELPLDKSLQNVMAEFQKQDEEKHSDEAIIRGAVYLGRDILGIFYDTATIPEQEGLKAGVRRILEAVEDPK